MKTAILFLLLFVAATTSGLANPMLMINGPAAPLPAGCSGAGGECAARNYAHRD